MLKEELFTKFNIVPLANEFHHYCLLYTKKKKDLKEIKIYAVQDTYATSLCQPLPSVNISKESTILESIQ
jgi:hypothetical protein